MRTLEIGSNSGFTLLEILAIIALLAFVLTIVAPNFTRGEEQTQAKYIGDLLKSDLSEAKDYTLLEQTDLTITFSNNGYSFQMGESVIKRVFKKYNFSFIMPDTSSKDKDSNQNSSDTSQNNSDTATKPELPTVKFSSDGACSGFSLGWTSDHFGGNLTINSDGMVMWTYAVTH